jgi:hypothetical protein
VLTCYLTERGGGVVATLYGPGRSGDDWTAQSYGETPGMALRRLVTYNRLANTPIRVHHSPLYVAVEVF